MLYDVKITGAWIRTHDLWIRKRECYIPTTRQLLAVISAGQNRLVVLHARGITGASMLVEIFRVHTLTEFYGVL